MIGATSSPANRNGGEKCTSEQSTKQAVDYHLSQYRMLELMSGPTSMGSGDAVTEH